MGTRIFFTVAVTGMALAGLAAALERGGDDQPPSGDSDGDARGRADGPMPAEAPERIDGCVPAPPDAFPSDCRRDGSPDPIPRSLPSRRPPRYWCRA